MTADDGCREVIRAHFLEGARLREQCLEQLSEVIENAGHALIRALRSGHKILIFGNGGSAADSQHFAAELTGRYAARRRALPAIALSTDTSALTAISNDFGFETVFERQVDALAQAGDIAIGMSTSGSSQNVVRGLRQAQAAGCHCIFLTGRGGTTAMALPEVFSIEVPESTTALVQEIHMAILHTWGAIIEQEFLKA